MADRQPEEHPCDQPILGLSSKTVKTIQFLAVTIGVLGVIVGFVVTYFQFQDQQQQQELQLKTGITNLAAQEKPGITSSTIQYILGVMGREKIEMAGISIPGTEFYMAEFEGAGWQGVDMDEVEFACSDQAYDDIRDWDEGDPKIPLCARLKKADFTGAYLREARFNYTDLREADFTAADLSETRINHSVLSKAKFLEGVSLRGVKIKNSDFSGARFSPKAKFRCTVMNEECVVLRQVDFSSAKMNDVLFRGAKIENVDFTGAHLKKASFDGELDRNGKQPLTVLESVCLRDTDLTGARFEDIKISNVDFTDAKLEGAKFTNVVFDRVALTDEQEKAAKFDDASHESLKGARQETLVSEDDKKVPCSSAWNRHIKRWRDKFTLAQ